MNYFSWKSPVVSNCVTKWLVEITPLSICKNILCQQLVQTRVSGSPCWRSPCLLHAASLLSQDVSIEILIPWVSCIHALISFKFLKKIKGWAWVVLTEMIVSLAVPTWINSKAVLKVLHFSPIAPEIKFEQSVKLFIFSSVIPHFHTCLKSALPLFPVFNFLTPTISLLLLTPAPKVLRNN